MKKLILFVILLWGSLALAAPRSDIDGYIQKAPKIKDHSDLQRVVDYITKGYKKDEDIARAALLWIVYNIDYDDYYYRQMSKDSKSRRDSSNKVPEQEDIIKARLGVCKDIAALYSEMLGMADIKSRVISGCHAPKNDKKACQSNPHAWNAVWIDHQWELVDPTFAMGQDRAMQDVTNQRRYEREVKKRERRASDTYNPRKERHANMSWFMVNPNKMAEDHQPDDSKWYLTKKTDRKKQD